MPQTITIDTKTANSLIEAILGLKFEVASLRQKISLSDDSYEESTCAAIEDLNNGKVVEFADINSAIKHLHK